MTPKLVLLTGPAAGEVAGVFSWGCKPREAYQLGVGNIQQAQWWDEVRDYWEAPNVIAGLPDAVAVEHGIRSLPGGEAWLVGLVLPGLRVGDGCGNHVDFPGKCPSCLKRNGIPERLAILAPDPPARLVNRVLDWSGQEWRCALSPTPEDYQHGTKPCHITIVFPGKNGRGGGGRDYWEDTWPEAVRAALGEVAPC